MRMCVGCRQMMQKRDLVRVVRRNEDGVVVADRSGRVSGRGAYICQNSACLTKAKKAKLLERALEATLDDTVYAQLALELERRELFSN